MVGRTSSSSSRPLAAASRRSGRHGGVVEVRDGAQRGGPVARGGEGVDGGQDLVEELAALPWSSVRQQRGERGGTVSRVGDGVDGPQDLAEEPAALSRWSVWEQRGEDAEAVGWCQVARGGQDLI